MIKGSPVKFPKRISLSEDAKDVIRKLLEKNPKKRLGSQSGIEEIKKHPFFASIDFDLIVEKKYQRLSFLNWLMILMYNILMKNLPMKKLE